MLGATYFGYEALLVLTGNPAVAHDYHLVFALMAWGYGLNSLALIPNALRMVEGFAGTALWGNAVAALFYLPAVTLLTPRYGVLAPVGLWFLVNAAMLAMFTMRAHRHALAGRAWSWFSTCILRQTVATAAVFALTQIALAHTNSMPVKIAAILSATGLAFVVSVAVSAELREAVVGFVHRTLAARAQTVPARSFSPR